ncbi:MAG: hypothetical protein ACOCUR_00830 [Nanoarchaeota archaeon]
MTEQTNENIQTAPQVSQSNESDKLAELEKRIEKLEKHRHDNTGKIMLEHPYK